MQRNKNENRVQIDFVNQDQSLGSLITGDLFPMHLSPALERLRTTELQDPGENLGVPGSLGSYNQIPSGRTSAVPLAMHETGCFERFFLMFSQLNVENVQHSGWSPASTYFCSNWCQGIKACQHWPLLHFTGGGSGEERKDNGQLYSGFVA